MKITTCLQGFVQNQKKHIIPTAVSTTSAVIGGVALGSSGPAAAIATAIGSIVLCIFYQWHALGKINMHKPRTEFIGVLLRHPVSCVIGALSAGVSLQGCL